VWLLLIGCTGSAQEELPLIDLDNWSFVELDSDVLMSHQPEVVECEINAFRVELDQLEIRTDYCNYAAISFTTQIPVKAGETLELLVLHSGLWALETTEAHVAFLLDGEMFWEDNPAIPSQATYFHHDSVSQNDLPVGTELQLHLHNHGLNDWKIGYFRKAI
jgi:hypothetical protein